jgi:hypothetical protein
MDVHALKFSGTSKNVIGALETQGEKEKEPKPQEECDERPVCTTNTATFKTPPAPPESN